MKRIDRRIFKKTFNLKWVLFICLILILLSTLMTSAYAILKNKLNITGNSSINPENIENMTKTSKANLEFSKISEFGNTFNYEITIYNNSDHDYHQWQLKIYDTGYITFPSWFEGKKEGNSWILNDSSWNNKIETGGNVKVNITFDVTKSPNNSMTIQEYAKYFVENNISLSVSNTAPPETEDIVITNKKATLTLGQFEEKVKTYTFKKNSDYICSNPKEKQYILTINNNSKYNYIGIRANIYLGNKNTLVSVSPFNVIYRYNSNSIFETPIWLQIPVNKTIKIYINIETEDDNFIPDIVVAALIDK